jgi:CRP-like cAMP-binding protein
VVRQHLRSASAGVALLDAVPEFERGVPADDLPLARRALVAPAVTVEPGPLELPDCDSPSGPFAFIILSGVVLRRTWLGERATAELLGPDDVIDVRPDEEWSLPCRTEYVVHEAATLAVLDQRFRVATRRWPALHEIVSAQLAAQCRRASRQLAAAGGLSRVDDRLAALFSDLADRWGRVTPDGVIIDLDLTHNLLGQLVGSRRPTVSLALSELSAAGTLVRRDDRTWLVAPEIASVNGNGH